ncbi:MAG: adenosylcobinamide-GDP ribazoletransferase [Pyrobaculum sp.]
MRCLKSLIAFFTVIPVEVDLDFSCVWALPYVVAPIIGGISALSFTATDPLVSYLVLLLLTGLNHLDGLADTADALMVRDKERLEPCWKIPGGAPPAFSPS